MGAKIICMASAKGGTGKTILTATFGAFLVALGKKVLLIDTDAATNGLTLMYLKEVRLQGEYAIAANRKPLGVYERILIGNPAEIVKLNNGVDLIPATYSFINTESVYIDDYKSSLSSILSFFKDSYDFIFLDAQSGSDIFAQYCMSRSISDEVVIVSEYDPMSAAGVERLKGLLREDLTYVRTWVLLNKMLPDFVQSFRDFLEVAKYLSPIPWDADVVKAYARRKLALDLENGNEHTLAVIQTLRTLLGDSISLELEAWIKERAAAIRQPIEDQYGDLEKELKALISERDKLERVSMKRKFLRVVTYSITFIGTLIILTSLVFNKLFDEFEKYILTISPMTWILIILGLVGLISSFFSFSRMFEIIKMSPQLAMEEARIRRRQDVLEEKLKKLESLRTADIEILIKSKEGI